LAGSEIVNEKGKNDERMPYKMIKCGEKRGEFNVTSAGGGKVKEAGGKKKVLLEENQLGDSSAKLNLSRRSGKARKKIKNLVEKPGDQMRGSKGGGAKTREWVALNKVLIRPRTTA